MYQFAEPSASVDRDNDECSQVSTVFSLTGFQTSFIAFLLYTIRLLY